jgi:hypothetical protein
VAQKRCAFNKRKVPSNRKQRLRCYRFSSKEEGSESYIKSMPNRQQDTEIGKPETGFS